MNAEGPRRAAGPLRSCFRAGALEVQDARARSGRRRVGAARRALGRDAQRLLVRLGEQLVELLEAALVELERRARDDDLRVLEQAGVRRRRRGRRRAPGSSRRPAPPQARRQACATGPRRGSAGPWPGRSAAGRRGAAPCARARHSRSRAACVRGRRRRRAERRAPRRGRRGSRLVRRAAAGCARAAGEPALWRSWLPRSPPVVGSGQYYRMGLMNWWAWSEASVPVSAVTIVTNERQRANSHEFDALRRELETGCIRGG